MQFVVGSTNGSGIDVHAHAQLHVQFGIVVCACFPQWIETLWCIKMSFLHSELDASKLYAVVPARSSQMIQREWQQFLTGCDST